MPILVVGDVNADLSAALAHFPAEGGDATAGSLQWGAGGAGANVAATTALLGGSSRLLARVGRDPAAYVALRAAHSLGADLRLVQYDERLATGLCFAAVSPGGERTFFSYRGANTALTNPEMDPLAGVRWLHLCGHALLEGSQREVALGLLHAAVRADLPISLDLCLPLLHIRRDELPALLPGIAVLFANELELAELRGSCNGDSLATLAAEHGVGMLVLKRGKHGCVVTQGATTHCAPGFAVTAVDTTGCGDAFVGGFIHARRRGADVAVCARLANALGALTATRPGAGDALPSHAELCGFLGAHEPKLLDLIG